MATFHLILFYLFLPVWRVACDICPEGWIIFERSCYKFISSPANWSSAETLCRKDGGNLAEISSPAENEFLAELKNNAHDAGAWVGLNDQGNEGTHIWVSSGNVANFTNWAVGQPSDALSAEDCVEMWSSGLWNEYNCTRNRKYFCERSIHEFNNCSPNPCLHGGTCVDGDSYYTCYCTWAFTGGNCNELNYCFLEPCQNEGTCIDVGGDYKCSCRPGFFGRNCEVTCPAGWTHFEGSCYTFNNSPTSWTLAQNLCRSNGGYLVEITSAAENAFLVDLRGNFSDTYAWTGLNILASGDSFIWVFSGSVVKFTNWANGQPNDPAFEKKCVEMRKRGHWNNLDCESHRSFFCERPPNKFSYCYLEPCQNEGACIDVGDDYECSCRPGFIGRNCEEFSICLSKPCSPGGTCVNVDKYYYTCHCASGYTGLYCEEFNNCFSNPCLNGGTCVKTDEDYTCTCTPGFTGRNCQNNCPEGWTKFEKSCYSLSSSPAKWFSAESLCRSDGGDLVDITNPVENVYLTHLMLYAPVTKAWTGLIAKGEGTYIWVSSGKVANYTSWAKDVTSDATSVKDCVEMWPSGQWNALDCETKRRYFCKRSVFGRCPTGMTVFGRSCYGLSTSTANWFSAQTSCSKGKGNIVEINSAAENAFLADLINKVFVLDAWIGLKYLHNNDTPIWVSSGNVANFTNWASGQPSDSSFLEACVEMWKSGQWNDLSCNSKRFYFCERSVISVIGRCPAGWTHFERRCYSFSSSRANLSLAQSSCSKSGGHLAEITSPGVNAFLVDLRKNAQVVKAWIGLADQGDEDTHIWVSSGNVTKFTNWAGGQPSNASSEEDCVEMWKSGQWKDLDCESERHYICELPLTDDFAESGYCFPNPCQNGGTCTESIDGDGNYTCSCRPNYFGRNCEDFNDCRTNKCLNGGTCVDGDKSYTCICTLEFTGTYCEETCPAGWTVFERRCYNFTASPADWNSAQTLCRKRGGNLVNIISAAENKFLVDLRDKDEATDAWIGLKSKTNEDNSVRIWVSSGNVAKFTNWAKGQPSGDECVEMWWSGKWNDLECDSKRSYFCERSTIVAN